VFIQGNKELLAIILSNLIDNAIKYTPAHGEIVVSISAQDKTTILTVSDTGPGIPEDKLPYVTERFYRIAGHHQSGAGLGLTTAKRAAEIMGAVLILQNKHMGHGLEAVLQFSNLTPMI
jgi:signal transduction histidine kinase